MEYTNIKLYLLSVNVDLRPYELKREIRYLFKEYQDLKDKLHRRNLQIKNLKNKMYGTGNYEVK